MKKFRRLRAFGAAFWLTLCLPLFGGGLLLADVNTRAVAFDDDRVAYAVDVGDALRTTAEEGIGGNALCPAPWRVLGWLLNAERTAAEWLLP